MTQLAKLLLEDAKRRVGKNEKLPEPEDQMTAPVKKLVQQGVSRNYVHFNERCLIVHCASSIDVSSFTMQRNCIVGVALVQN